jgi:hypothetical protein
VDLLPGEASDADAIHARAMSETVRAASPLPRGARGFPDSL